MGTVRQFGVKDPKVLLDSILIFSKEG